MSAKQWTIALLMCAFSVLSYFDRTILSVAAPTMMREFGITPERMGVVFSSFQLSYTILMVAGGWLADRWGVRVVLTVMGVGAGLTTAAVAGLDWLAAIAGIVPALVVLRLAFGVVTAPLYPSTGRANAMWMSGAQRSRVQGLVNGGAGLGGAISPMLVTALIAWVGWRVSFAAAGAVTVAAGLAWWLAAGGTEGHGAVAGSRVEWGGLLRNTNLRWLTFGYFAVDYFEYIFFYWIYYYLGEVKKLPAQDTAFYATWPFVAWMLLMPAGGWMADRLVVRLGRGRGLKAVGVGGLALSAVCLFAGVGASDLVTSVVLMSLALGFCAASDVVFWTATLEIAGKDTGAACGILNMGGNIGGILAPALTPLIAARWGWEWGLYAGGLVALGGLAAWFGVRLPDRPSRP
ncbi:MAG: MFS transporter [Acidobacteria bacterium]|nr:MFS transporter [Acidobacteriota bacterium]